MTSMATSTGGSTVTSIVSDQPVDDSNTSMLVVPGAMPLTSSWPGRMTATSGLAGVHRTRSFSFIGAPPCRVAMTVTATASPVPTRTSFGETAMRTMPGNST
jgi:hypothetical protein